MKKLAVTVFLADDEEQMHELPAGTVPPDWAVDRITNPYAWVDDPVDDVQDAQRAVVEAQRAFVAAQAEAAAAQAELNKAAETGSATLTELNAVAQADAAASQADLNKAAETASATLTELNAAVPATPVPTPTVTVGTAPPQSGPDASRQVWEEFATANGITVEANWKRGDIIEACIAAGIAV